MVDAAHGHGEGPELSIGAHTLLREAPDLVRLVTRGNVSGEEVAEIVRGLQQFAAEDAPMLLLLDARRMGVISPRARRAALAVPVCYRGSVVFGASFTIRTIAFLVSESIRLLKPTMDYPTAFFDTEAEALAWIDVRRRQLRDSRSKP